MWMKLIFVVALILYHIDSSINMNVIIATIIASHRSTEPIGIPFGLWTRVGPRNYF